MPATRTTPHEPRFRGLYPDWSGTRPVGWYFGEELLEARRESRFPTNAEGPDEEVNIYLIHLLTGFLGGRTDARVRPGADPLLTAPSPALPRREQAARYRANGDHRLLHLGLMDRGDSRRRRRVPLGETASSARRRDLEIGRSCYALAADLLEGRRSPASGPARVLRLLADHFEEYVHVLAVLACRRWRMGAVLDERELEGLLAGPTAPTGPLELATMDGLLDLVAEYRKRPDEGLAARIGHWARALGVDMKGPLDGGPVTI